MTRRQSKPESTTKPKLSPEDLIAKRLHKANELAKAVYGAKSLHQEQAEVLAHLFAGNDVLGVMPTSRGKSLIFQIYPRVTKTMAVVITPLKALMRDQVRQAREKGFEAAYTASDDNESEDAEEMLSNGCDLFYVSPERLRSRKFRVAIRHAGRPLGLIAVDEAHVVEWGNRFRPAYAHVKTFILKSDCPTVALTATATPQGQDEIISMLGMTDAIRVVGDPIRKNINYSIVHGSPWSGVINRMSQWMREGSGGQLNGRYLVYCQSQKATELVSAKLNGVRHSISRSYHAGKPEAERKTVEHAFVKGDIKIICCTNAFGMGINVPDIREVVHFGIPKNLEAYVQEVGRAGRDGLPCRGVLLYDEKGVDTVLRILDSDKPDPLFVAEIWNTLNEMERGTGVVDVGLFDLAERAQAELGGEVNPYKTESSLLVLDAASAIRVTRMETSKVLSGNRAALQAAVPQLSGSSRAVADAILRLSPANIPTIQMTLDKDRIANAANIGTRAVGRVVESLVSNGWLTAKTNYNRLLIDVLKAGEHVNDVVDFSVIDRRREYDKWRLEQMLRYVAAPDYYAFIRNYFGYKKPESE